MMCYHRCHRVAGIVSGLPLELEFTEITCAAPVGVVAGTAALESVTLSSGTQDSSDVRASQTIGQGSTLS